MTKLKDPAFLFYPSDFLTGTIFMSDEQVGRYIKLLCVQHQKGRLHEKDMLKICGTYDDEVFTKFTKDENGLYFNERLEMEASKRKAYSESRRANRLSSKDKDEQKAEPKQENSTGYFKDINIHIPKEKIKELKEKGLSDRDIHFMFVKDYFLQGKTIWIEQMAMKSRVSPQKMKERLNEFLNQQYLAEDFYRPLNDIQRHFVNWVKTNMN